MAKEESPLVVSQPSTGIHTDNAPIDQPAGTMRYCINGTVEAKDGGQRKISNNMSNYATTNRPVGYEIIGDCYLQDDTSFILMTNPTTKRDQFGLLYKNGVYKMIGDTGVLGLKITHQCDIIFRVRRGNEWVVYWTDGDNLPRTFNISREYNFYTRAYQVYLKGGGLPHLYTEEKWDRASFDLVKSYRLIPNFSNVQVIDTGNILPGSYNFAVQLVDEDLNPTEWINVSNTVNIFNDNSGNSYERIRGSRNVTSDSQSWPRANKSIKLTITSLDVSFPYYRVAIIHSNGMTGVPNKALASDLYPTSDSNFIYTGNDANLAEVSLNEILVDNEVVFAPKHIEQLENKLILLNGRGKGINWCDFQRYASKIYTDVTFKEVILNKIESEPNVKNAKSTFQWRGYMPGEVYSVGIVYIFNDGTLSPVFHIPGRSKNNYRSKMLNYELSGKYLDIHNCSTYDYWGNDAEGNSLLNKPIRHHRFPFRHEVGKPLYQKQTSVTSTSRYRLTVSIHTNPGWVPNPPPDDTPYPQDASGNDLVIDYRINYQKIGSPTIESYAASLTEADTHGLITVYEDVQPLDNTTFPSYGQLDPASPLDDYQVAGNERFIFNFIYAENVSSSSIDNDIAEIFGFEFSNIEKPHPDVVGFYIVRNERLDDDKMILDTAILGPMIQYEQYKSFGLIMPKPFYTTSGCSGAATPSATLQYFDKGVWFFNPEFEYYQKKLEFNKFVVEGKYNESSINMPTISNVEGSQCNIGGSKGVYINDVQAGTSYNPEVNKKKDKDDDGFDLLIGYRNTNVVYEMNSTSIVMPPKSRIFYLNAASYQNFEDSTYYNVSVDNKIGEYISDTALASELFLNGTTGKNSLVYAAMVKDDTQSLYSNFMTRNYFKEHNNPELFLNKNVINGVKVFNGDVQISGFNFVSMVYYDMVAATREKKNKVWKIVAGAVLVAVGVVLALYSGGATLAISAVGIGLLGAIAVSYGISLAMAGVKFEQFKKMVDVDYEIGLKETVTDGGVFETIRDTIETDDDTIRWFADRVSNIYMESSVPFGLRSGLTCGITDFTDAPVAYSEPGFRTYLTEKLTVIDRDQGSGRLYKGYPTSEVYDMNLDFTRFNKEKIFSHLPIEFDCCADSPELHPLRVWWSETSFQEEKVDNFRVFLPNNYRDIEGVHGEITDSYRLGSSLFIHTKEALWHLPQQNQERVTNEIVSFIGTGNFFSVPPRLVVDDQMGSAGTQHKWGTVKTKNGVLFLSELEGKAYLHGGKLGDTTIGNRNWFKNNLKSNLSYQLFANVGIIYPNDNNPANPNGIGIFSGYDARFERIIVTKKDYLFLGDMTKIIQKFDPAVDYAPGTIFIDENGFHEIQSIEHFGEVPIPLSDWQQVDSVLSKPALVPITATKASPLITTHGKAYMQGGDIIYVADPVGFATTDSVPINMNSCANESIAITIHL